jgi:prepilin-type processing-associated H-X9-DG protein
MTKTSHSAAYLLRGFFDVLLLALVDAAVFQQHDFAFGDIETAIDPILDQAHRLAQLGGHDIGHRLEGDFLGPLAFGRTAQVGGDHDLGASLDGVLDGRHGGGDAGVGSDFAFLDGHVQVGADEDAFALQVEVGHTEEFGHCSAPVQLSGKG